MINSIQQFNGTDWISVNGAIYKADNVITAGHFLEVEASDGKVKDGGVIGSGELQVNGNTVVWNAIHSTTSLNITSGTENGAISVGGVDVAVKGLEDAAFVDTTIFAGAGLDTGVATITPAGTISVGTGTANYTPAGNITIDQYTPEGTISGGELTLTPSTTSFNNVTGAELAATPTFTGAAATLEHTISNMGSISASTVIKPEGHLTDAVLDTSTALNGASLTGGAVAQFTAGTFSQGSLPAWTGTVNNETLVFTWDAGTLPTHAADTFTPNTLQGITTTTASFATGIKTQATFVGDNTTVAIEANVTGMSIADHSFTPAGTISKPSITLTSTPITYVTGVTGSVSDLTFTGKTATITGTFAGTAVELKFNGTADTHTHTQTAS